MATKKGTEAKQAEKQETKKLDMIKYKIEFPDGTISEGSATIREFAPNTAKGFKNSGFQCKIASGNYSGSLMIIDYLKQVKL